MVLFSFYFQHLGNKMNNLGNLYDLVGQGRLMYLVSVQDIIQVQKHSGLLVMLQHEAWMSQHSK